VAIRIEEVFPVHNYSGNMKARVATFNLTGGASIWWEDLKNVKGITKKESDLETI
jgi:hypothetical protein